MWSKLEYIVFKYNKKGFNPWIVFLFVINRKDLKNRINIMYGTVIIIYLIKYIIFHIIYIMLT